MPVHSPALRQCQRIRQRFASAIGHGTTTRDGRRGTRDDDAGRTTRDTGRRRGTNDTGHGTDDTGHRHVTHVPLYTLGPSSLLIMKGLNMKIGYARVSTQDQETSMQIDALKFHGCELIYQEKASGSTRRGRKELDACLQSLRKGDILVVYKIDRIARSLFDLLDILRHLDEVGATIKSVTEPLDTTNGLGVFVVQILGAVAQLERSMIRERSIAGQQAARRRGSVIGRARVLSPDDEASVVSEYLSGRSTYQALATRYGVSLSVVKRAVYRVTKPSEYLKRAKI